MKWKIYYFLLNGYKVKQILESSPAINETLNVLQREPGKWVKILKLFSSLTNYGGQVYKMCPKCFPSLSICWGVSHIIKERRKRRSCHAYQLRGENLNILSLRIFQECHHLDPFQSHHCTGELHNKYIHVYTYLCQCTRDNVHSTTEYEQISVKRSSKGGHRQSFHNGCCQSFLQFPYASLHLQAECFYQGKSQQKKTSQWAVLCIRLKFS